MLLYVGERIPTEFFHLIARAVSEWSRSQEEKVRGGLLGKSVEQITTQLFLGRCVVLMDGVTVVGFATLYELIPGNWELGTVVVNPSYRGQGRAWKVYEGIDLLHRSLGGTLWETTKHPAVVKMSERYGIMCTAYTSVPEEVYGPLCRDAGCFVPANGPSSRCAKSWNVGGPCFLCVRSEAVALSSQ